MYVAGVPEQPAFHANGKYERECLTSLSLVQRSVAIQNAPVLLFQGTILRPVRKFMATEKKSASPNKETLNGKRALYRKHRN